MRGRSPTSASGARGGPATAGCRTDEESRRDEPGNAEIFAIMKRFCVVVPVRTPKALTDVNTAIAAAAIGDPDGEP